MTTKLATASLVVILVAGLMPNVMQQRAYAVFVGPTNDPNVLVNAIVGPGITIVGAPILVGIDGQQAVFGGGIGSVGFHDGIVLTTGNASLIPGPNSAFVETMGSGSTGPADDINNDLGQPGDADLSALAGFPTFDANVLEFDFQFGDGTQGGDLSFNYAFASEEYLNFVGSQFNDGFALFVDGVNIAKLPDNSPVTINNINPTSNPAFYVNNVGNTDGFPVAGLDFHFDGRTRVLTAEALGLGPGVHHMKFAVADTSDGILDAGVFIQAGTFSSQDPCDGVDNNGNSIIDEGIVGVDDDGDGTIDEPRDACPVPEEICGDGIDNDGDGLVDEDCPVPEEICGDGIDNDGDGLVDEDCPLSTGKITAGGSQVSKGTSFGFNIQSDGTKIKGQLQYQDLDRNMGINLHNIQFTSLSISADKTFGTFSGTATANGTPVTFTVIVEDKGEPGTNDTFHISIPELPYTKAGTLTKGNIQIH